MFFSLGGAFSLSLAVASDSNTNQAIHPLIDCFYVTKTFMMRKQEPECEVNHFLIKQDLALVISIRPRWGTILWTCGEDIGNNKLWIQKAFLKTGH